MNGALPSFGHLAPLKLARPRRSSGLRPAVAARGEGRLGATPPIDAPAYLPEDVVPNIIDLAAPVVRIRASVRLEDNRTEREKTSQVPVPEEAVVSIHWATPDGSELPRHYNNVVAGNVDRALATLLSKETVQDMFTPQALESTTISRGDEAVGIQTNRSITVLVNQEQVAARRIAIWGYTGGRMEEEAGYNYIMHKCETLWDTFVRHLRYPWPPPKKQWFTSTKTVSSPKELRKLDGDAPVSDFLLEHEWEIEFVLPYNAEVAGRLLRLWEFDDGEETSVERT
jgi:hypothetical protein